MRRSLALIAAVMVGMTGCASRRPPSPSPFATVSASATASATPTATEPPATYQLAPPKAVQDWFSINIHADVRPLTAIQLGSVKVTREQADARALAEAGPGYGSGHDHFVWTKVGCVFLGFWSGIPTPRHAPPIAAYLVQVLAKPVKAFQGENVEIEVIDAQIGEFTGGFWYSPTTVLGTTCGERP